MASKRALSADTVSMDGTLRQAIEIGEDALTDAHANAPLPEVAEWDALAHIVVMALVRAGWTLTPPTRTDGTGA